MITELQFEMLRARVEQVETAVDEIRSATRRVGFWIGAGIGTPLGLVFGNLLWAWWRS